MYCDRCGTLAAEGQIFCGACGRAFTAAPPAPAPGVSPTGMEKHFRVLGFLWIAVAAMFLLPGLFLTGWGGIRFPFHHISPVVWPWIRIAGGFAFIYGAAAAVAGWGLLERTAWARPLAIALAALALFKPPLITALGVYTLWALAGNRGSAHYDRSARI